MNNRNDCFKKCLLEGICSNNPIFSLMLGLCPTLAVTVTALNGVTIGVAGIFVLLGSNVIISLIKGFIAPQVRIPCFVLIIAAFVTITKLILQAYMPLLYAKLGLFVDIMVVNCIILGRAEAFACKKNVIPSIADALGMGIGFTLACVLIGSIREILGSGAWFGIKVTGAGFNPAIAMILPPGAFLTIGVLMALLNNLNEIKKRRSKLI
ncbi:MAG: electron transport complex subunit E [Candidatus Omnitrophica bacterium]|nr:electron transport complex subunit E [Candidatus Omnitrophota bacterium]